jgi:hypothetical protein
VKAAAVSSLPRQQALHLSLLSKQLMGRGSKKEKRGEKQKNVRREEREKKKEGQLKLDEKLKRKEDRRRIREE